MATFSQVCASVSAIFGIHRITPTPGSILATARCVVAVLSPTDALSVLSAAVGIHDATHEWDTLALCCGAALLARGDGGSDPAGRCAAAGAAFVGCLERVLEGTAGAPRRQADVECAAHCTAFLFPRFTGRIVAAAEASIVAVGGTAAYAVTTAIEVLAVVAHALQRGEGSANTANGEDGAAVHTRRLLDTALRCLGMSHRDTATIPLVTRRILVPLLIVESSADAAVAAAAAAAATGSKSKTAAVASEGGKKQKNAKTAAAQASNAGPAAAATAVASSAANTVVSAAAQAASAQSAAESRRMVIAHVRRLAANGQHSESTVLLAALFDVVFPITGALIADGHGSGRDGSDDDEPDLRSQDFFWAVLSNALRVVAPDAGGEEGARVATLHTQAVYLLKRLVERTARQFPAPPQQKTSSPTAAGTVRFHALFPWTPGASEGHWEAWFLAWEALNEFGMHLITPMVTKIDTLFAHSACGEATAPGSPSSVFPALWVERVLHKCLVHANVGARKAALGWLFCADAAAVAARLSVPFLFGAVVATAADARLCTEVDRVVLPGSFLDCKAFGGRAEPLLPHVVPSVTRVEGFYQRLAAAFPSTDEGAAALRAGVAAMLRTVVPESTPRFGLAVTLRAALAVAIHAPRPLLDKALLRVLLAFLRDVVQDRFSQWLEARATAVLMEVVLASARGGSIVAEDPAFERLLAVLGKGGETGGKSMTVIDGGGAVAGVAGGALPQRLVLARLQRHVAELDGVEASNFLRLLHTAAARCDAVVGRWLAAADSHRPSDRVGRGAAHGAEDTDTSEASAHLGASWTMRGAKVATALLPLDPSFGPSCAIVARLRSELLSLGSRAAASAEHAVVVLSLFAEVSAAAWDGVAGSSRAGTKVVPWDAETLVAAWEALLGMARASLAAALTAAPRVVDVASLGLDAWSLQRTEHWDVLCAALATVARCVALNARRGHNKGAQATTAGDGSRDDDDDDEENRDVVVSPGDAADAFASLPSALPLFREALDVARAAASRPSRDAAGPEFARLVVARNACRVVYTLACVHATGDGCLASVVEGGPAAGAALVDALLALPALHLSVPDAPCSLTSLTWGTVATQYYRGVWNTVHALCRGVVSRAPCAAFDATALSVFAARVAETAAERLHECSASNPSALFDVLLWATPLLPKTSSDTSFDAATSLKTMMNHMQDGLRRDAYRCGALTAVAVAAAAATCDDANDNDATSGVAATDALRSLLHDNEDLRDRVVYFVAATMGAGAIRQCEGTEGTMPTWTTHRDALIHLAVFVGTTFEDDEAEAGLAALEPVLAAGTRTEVTEDASAGPWGSELRRLFPPALRLSALARTIAVSTIAFLASRDAALAKDLILTFLRWNTTCEDVAHEPCMPNSRTHRSRIRLWQLTCLLAHSLAPEAWPEAIAVAMGECMPIMNMGSVRRYVEIFLITGLLARPDCFPVLLDFMRESQLRPQVLGSCCTLAVHLTLSNGLTTHPEVLAAFLPELVKLTSSHQHLIRLIAQIGVHEVVRSMLVASGRDDDGNVVIGADHTPAVLPPALTAELLALYQYLHASYDCVKNRERYFDVVVFDASVAMTPHNLFCVQRKETECWLVESVPPAMFERVRFVGRELRSLLAAVTPFERFRCRVLADTADAAAFGVLRAFRKVPRSRFAHDDYLDYHLEASQTHGATSAPGPGAQAQQQQTKEALGAAAVGADANVQRKVTSWWHSEVHNEIHPRAIGTRKKQSIVVVATFLDNAVNIAGLFRCAEIFAVERIVVADKKIFQHPMFVATARSAELWMPWDEVSEHGLPVYLLDMKHAGYTVVGIEQTATSEPMPQYNFPERTVIVMGAEGTGMPASILPLMDACVEIPQFGLIRSLNVHVSGAIALYEFTRQHWMVTGEGVSAGGDDAH